MAAGGERCTAVENPNVIQPQKSTLKDVVALGILAIDPPGEVHQQLVKHRLQKLGPLCP